MKLINFFIDIFCISVFLSLGSLFTVVSLHILPIEDALIQVQTIYESSAQSFQIGFTGFLLILVGLILSKKFVKKSRRDDDFIVLGSSDGRVTITYGAVNELTQRVLRKFDSIRQPVVSTSYDRNGLSIVIDAQVLQDSDLNAFTGIVEKEVREKITKTLRDSAPIFVSVRISQIVPAENKYALHST